METPPPVTPAPPRDAALAVAEVSVLSLLFLLAVSSNLLVLLALRSPRAPSGPLRRYLRHLSAADLAAAAGLVLPQLLWDLTDRFRGPDPLCRLTKYLQGVAMFASAYVAVAMAWDRHRAICRPLGTARGTARDRQGTRRDVPVTGHPEGDRGHHGKVLGHRGGLWGHHAGLWVRCHHSWIWDHHSWIRDHHSWIWDRHSWLWDHHTWLWDHHSWIRGHHSWIRGTTAGSGTTTPGSGTTTAGSGTTTAGSGGTTAGSGATTAGSDATRRWWRVAADRARSGLSRFPGPVPVPLGPVPVPLGPVPVPSAPSRFPSALSRFPSAPSRFRSALSRFRSALSRFRRRWDALATAWALALLFGLPQVGIFGQREVAPGERDCWAAFAQPWGARAYVTWVALAVLVAPALLLGVLLVAVARALRGSPGGPGGLGRARAKSHRMAAVVLGVVRGRRSALGRSHMGTRGVFVLCWTPFFCAQLWAVWDPRAPTEGPAFTILMLLASLTSCTNPWISAAFSTSLARAMGRVLCPCRSHRGDTGGQR
ncbi:vasopressin V2 receptor-like [Camarhynchus parvulus]|uniref:vasopressin V2 receptor-like n=1 Tax=Geospiza parvula TaxID=87175 RepID=UPI00123829F7|nr:vasopressin V2 receptor-like [Camarhynchus parvulus]